MLVHTTHLKFDIDRDFLFIFVIFKAVYSSNYINYVFDLLFEANLFHIFDNWYKMGF